MDLLEYIVSIHFTFNCQIVLQSGCTFLCILTSNVWEFQLSTSTLDLGIVRDFYLSHCYVFVVISPVVLICILLVTNNVDHLFMFLYIVRVSLWCVSSNLLPIFSSNLASWGLRVLYIFWIKVFLSVLSFKNTLYYFVGCLFILLRVSSKWHKYIILKCNLSRFFF